MVAARLPVVAAVAGRVRPTPRCRSRSPGPRDRSRSPARRRGTSRRRRVGTTRRRRMPSRSARSSRTERPGSRRRVADLDHQLGHLTERAAVGGRGEHDPLDLRRHGARASRRSCLLRRPCPRAEPRRSDVPAGCRTRSPSSDVTRPLPCKQQRGRVHVRHAGAGSPAQHRSYAVRRDRGVARPWPARVTAMPTWRAAGSTSFFTVRQSWYSPIVRSSQAPDGVRRTIATSTAVDGCVSVRSYCTSSRPYSSVIVHCARSRSVKV